MNQRLLTNIVREIDEQNKTHARVGTKTKVLIATKIFLCGIHVMTFQPLFLTYL